MLRIREWLVRVGFWSHQEGEPWSWHPQHFRLRFWRTPTNAMHTAYRNTFKLLGEGYARDLQATYEQGLNDGARQLADLVQQSQTNVPVSQRYLN